MSHVFHGKEGKTCNYFHPSIAKDLHELHVICRELFCWFEINCGDSMGKRRGRLFQNLPLPLSPCLILMTIHFSFLHICVMCHVNRTLHILGTQDVIVTTSSSVVKPSVVIVLSTSVSSMKSLVSHYISTGSTMEVPKSSMEHWREESANSTASHQKIVVVFERLLKLVPASPSIVATLFGVSYPAAYQLSHRKSSAHHNP